jgi:hypothetical protein
MRIRYTELHLYYAYANCSAYARVSQSATEGKDEMDGGAGGDLVVLDGLVVRPGCQRERASA